MNLIFTDTIPALAFLNIARDMYTGDGSKIAMGLIDLDLMRRCILETIEKNGTICFRFANPALAEWTMGFLACHGTNRLPPFEASVGDVMIIITPLRPVWSYSMQTFMDDMLQRNEVKFQCFHAG